VILASELQDMSMQNLQMQTADPVHIQVLMWYKQLSVKFRLRWHAVVHTTRLAHLKLPYPFHSQLGPLKPVGVNLVV
jgi:hypothetical protein